MKKLFTGVFVLMVLFSLTISAEAFDSKSIYRDEGMAAYAGWYEYTDGVYTDTFIQATTSNDGTDIYVDIWTYDENTGDSSGKWGYMFTQEDVFTIDKKLESATLSPVDIELYVYDWNTDTYTMETVTIAAQWTGEGDVMKSSSKSIFKYDDFTSKYSDKSSFREATATGSINDEDLGTSDFGELIKFKSVSMYMEK
ncbi:MAG: hypothetical protein MIO93_07140 [ANME-2 cluster archaeon]|jgi:hypothetical protein|nr:hypothetical protein [ANME-2 cluster archaeon]